MNDLTLVVRRHLRAPPSRVFAAWVEPEHLVQWWGPEGVACPEANVDLRVGGAYSIANQLPDGRVLWLTGVFEVIERPDKLVYTWNMDGGTPERVTVQFLDRDGETEVVIRHERIASQPVLDAHNGGWMGCVDGLERLLAATSSS